MSITAELTRISQAKSDIIQAIADKGVSVPSGSKLDDFPALISSISGGGEFDITNIVPIVPVSKIYVVDDNGYIGYDITKYFQYVNQTIYHNFAILASGNDFSQMGLGQVTITPTSTDNIGGREYSTVTIGGVTWMSENLDFKFSGLVVGSSGTTYDEPRANYYSNNEAQYGYDGNKYGLMYNWVAVNYLHTHRSTLIPGWHVPTNAEWQSLISTAGGSSLAGTKLKSDTEWTSGAGDNVLGFNALPAGYYDATFSAKGTRCNFFTSTDNGNNNVYGIKFGTSSTVETTPYMLKRAQISLRLVKDSA